MPQDQPSTGKRTLRIGKYEVLGHIATGGMGTVYKALDTELKRLVALKVLSPELAKKPRMLERFRREAESAARLRHENIVTIFECGESNGTHFLALEYIKGKDLHDYVGQRGKLKPEEARGILIQAARALDHAHRQGVVHRDIKPSNFLVMGEGDRLVVKLTDLGLARFADDEQSRITKDHTTVGTVDYMAPEQAWNSRAADIRSDIYSLGCTFYHMLAGHCPFPKGSVPERIRMHERMEPPDIRKFNPAVPDDLWAVLKNMLAKKPADRFQTPEELLDALAGADGKTAELETSSNRPPSFLAELAQPAPAAPAPRDVLKQLTQGDDSEEKPIPAAPPSRRRFRDQDETDASPGTEKTTSLQDKPNAPTRRPSWTVWAIGGGAVVVAAVVVMVLTGKKPPADLKQPVDPHPIVQGKHPEVDPTKEKEKDPEQVKEVPVPTPGKAWGPTYPAPLLFEPSPPLDREALRKEFLGPFAAPPSAPPKEAKVFVVSRWSARPGVFATLTEAWQAAATEPAAIIEIQDQGPLFVPGLPPSRCPHVWLRAGTGHRPLLIWEGTGANPEKAAIWAAMNGGHLDVQGLDLALAWNEPRAQQPACFFQLDRGNLRLRDCTIASSGAHPQGVYLARLERAEAKDKDGPAPPRLHFTNCYAHGADLMPMRLAGRAEVLIDGCLLAGGERHTLHLETQDREDITLRLVRSTLVTGADGLRLHGATANANPAPALRVLVWDTLLARANPAGASGDLVNLGTAGSGKLRWKVVNGLYAGWKNLLLSADKTIPGGNLAAWHGVMGYSQGDLELSESWPPGLPAALEETAASAFRTQDTPAWFAATSQGGALGATLGRLPPEQRSWLARSTQPYPLPALALPDLEDPPTVPPGGDGLFHGEKVDLNKVDLGQYLQVKLQTLKPGPRVVLLLSGKGEVRTRALRVRGIAHLVLAADKDDPLTLVVNPSDVPDQGGLIDMEDGLLDLVNMRVRLDNSRTAPMPPHLIRLRGGSLRLTRCRLQGPLGKGPDFFKSLIHWDNVRDGDGPWSALALQDSVLMAGKPLLEFTGQATLFKLRNNVLLCGSDALVIQPTDPAQPRLAFHLERNTMALHRAFLHLKSKEGAAAVTAPIVVQSSNNYFVNPFLEEPQRPALLKLAGPEIPNGLLLWQGQDNVFEGPRWNGYLQIGADAPPWKLGAWKDLWGPQTEQRPQVIEAAASAKAFAIDAPNYERLNVPPRLRPVGGPPIAGADLQKLGVLKKK